MSWCSRASSSSSVREYLVYGHDVKFLAVSPEVSVVASRHYPLPGRPLRLPGVVSGMVGVLEREGGQSGGGIGIVPQLVVKLPLTHGVRGHGVPQVRVAGIGTEQSSTRLEGLPAGV